MKALLAALVLLLASALPGAGTADLISGRFKLSDARDGKAVSSATYHGKVQLVFFGFTHCRLVCPIGLHKAAQALDLLGEDAAQVAPLFITTDPARDTPKLMREFTANFSPAIVPLVGTRRAIDAAMRSFRLEAQKVEQKSADEYQMDHPAIFYVMDRQGRFVRTLPSGGNTADIAAQLRKELSRR